MKNSIVSSSKLRRMAALAVKALKNKRSTLATAESCTGGLIAKSVTDIAGSSAVLAGGMVTYTNRIKIDVLGVDENIIKEHSEVSYACAEAMAKRAKEVFGTDYALSATGYAGPGGGTEKDPTGTVYIGIATPTGVRSERICIENATRAQVRNTVAHYALKMLLDEIR
ncbi:MAG: CinA family protein [Ruminococcaceae bacterium]|nr:CinA family protein [Oscillospiraceae bacterium]